MKKFIGTILLLAIASGCPSKSSNEDDAGVDASAGGDGGTDDAGPGGCVPTSTSDEPDSKGVDANCDGIDGDEADAIFVALPPLGDDANPGTKSAPFATLALALETASSSGKHQVLVSEGIYDGALTLKSGISIFGGYLASNEWHRASSAISLIYGESPVLTAESITEPTRVARMTIVARDATVASASSIAVVVRSSNGLFFEDCEIRAGNGANGTPGSTPAQPAKAPDGSPGGIQPVMTGTCEFQGGAGTGGGGSSPWCNPGGTGGSMGGGAGHVDPTRGRYGGVSSNSLCTSLGDPEINAVRNGQTGAAGSHGFLAAAIGSLSANGYVPADGHTGIAGDFGGGGDGGPGGEFFYSDEGTSPGGRTGVLFVSTPPGGGGGAGGRGGLGGGFGTGGGASIAVLSWSSELHLIRTRVRSANGGAGGAGAPGGQGGLGGTGGDAGPADERVVPGTGNYYICVVLSTIDPAGSGGQGGTGGAGSGGSGGPSIAVVLGGGSTIDSSNAPIIDLGNGGAAGAGGVLTNAGAAGAVHTTLTVP